MFFKMKQRKHLIAFKVAYLFISVCFFSPCNSGFADTQGQHNVVSPAHTTYSITSNNLNSSRLIPFEYAIDTTQQFSFKDVASGAIPFIPTYDQKSIGLGFGKPVVWVRVTLMNSMDTQTIWYLQQYYGTITHMDFYSPDTNYECQEYYIWAPHSKVKIPFFKFVYDIKLAKGETKTYYWRVDSKGPVTLSLLLQTPKMFRHRLASFSLFYGAYFGVLFILFLL